jgi:hypothetical protein
LRDSVIEYKSTSDKQKREIILNEIEYLLQIVRFQTWDIAYEMRLVEEPGKFEQDRLLKKYFEKYSHTNALNKNHLIIPLMLYLFVNHNNNRSKSTLETSLNFMRDSKEYLKPGDFTKMDNGSQRFITNTRFASLELRNFGLLRSDKKHFYKHWQLSPFGILIAGQLYLEHSRELLQYLVREASNKSAKLFADSILFKLTQRVNEKNRFIDIIHQLLNEEVVAKYLDLYSRKFISFSKRVSSVLDESNRNRKEARKHLSNYLDEINEDEQFSQLADAIILKHDIDINMSAIFKILYK